MKPTLQASDLDVEGLVERLHGAGERLKEYNDTSLRAVTATAANLLLMAQWRIEEAASALQSLSAQIAAEKARADKAEGSARRLAKDWEDARRKAGDLVHYCGDLNARVAAAEANLAAANKQIEEMRGAELHWDSIDTTCMWAAVPQFWICYRISLQADRTKVLRLEWLGNKTDTLGHFFTWKHAKAAAQADIRARTALSHEAHNG
jgi:hypothetical protein